MSDRIAGPHTLCAPHLKMALAAAVSLPERSLSNVSHECKAEAEAATSGEPPSIPGEASLEPSRSCRPQPLPRGKERRREDGYDNIFLLPALHVRSIYSSRA